MRHRTKLAEADTLYRARMVSIGPDGSSTSWFEGPYVKPWQATERITFWQHHYAREREGWRIAGRLETASPVWVSVQNPA